MRENKYNTAISEQKDFVSASDLLLILIENTNYTFSMNELQQSQPFHLLYRNVSPSTIRRDVNKLLNLELLKIVKASVFQININALD